MNTKLEQLLELVYGMPEVCVEEALKSMTEIIESHEATKTTKPCPHCQSENVVRNGKKDGKQRYYCSGCKKTFTDTTNTVSYNSHYGEAVWNQVTRDTLEGQSLDKTAEKLGLSHQTVFNMRHKILMALEQEETRNPTKLGGVSELDETYVLESLKGTKFQADYWRGPRKHGAVAKRAGISQEYIGICAGVERKGAAVSVAVGRSVPEGADIAYVFGKRLDEQTLVLCDGAKSYNILSFDGKCEVAAVPSGKDVKTDSFYNINTVNNFHGHIQERYRSYRGVATKYLNRYGILFAKSFKCSEHTVNELCKLLMSTNVSRFNSIDSVTSKNLLDF